MPRQTETSVTRSNDRYTTQPSVGLEVIPHAIPDKTAGLEGLSRALSGFFGDVSSAIGSVQEAEFLKRKVEIQQENDAQQFEATKIALEGGTLTQEQAKDLDFVTPYNKAKAGRAVAEDATDFVSNVLPTVGIDANPFQALGQYTKTKLEGIENKQFGAFYLDGMLRATSDAISKNRADLFVARRAEAQQDWQTQVGMMLKTQQIGSGDQLMGVLAQGAKLRSPLDPIEGEKWAAAAALNIARSLDSDGAILNQVVQMLQSPVTPTEGNPQGLSFSTRFPEGFNDLVRNAEKNTNVGLEKAVDDWSYRIDQKLASKDIGGALVDLASAIELHGDQPQFRARNLQIIEAISSTADATAGKNRLLNVTASGVSATPDDVSKYGDEVIQQVISQQGPLKAASLMTAWNAIPPDFKKSIEMNLTKVGSPEAIAAYYSTVARPMFETMPATLLGSLNEDSQFVFQYMRSQEVLRNADLVASATDAAAALKGLKQSGMSAKDVVLWDQAKPGAKASFMSDLRSTIADALNVDAVDEGLVNSVYMPAVQARALRYMAVGMDPIDAGEKAVKDITETAAARATRLPAPGGDTYAAQDLSPDTAFKWQARTLPDGEEYDPVEHFREEVTSVPFIPADVGVVPGDETPIDGGMDVVEADGVTRIVFGVGQRIDFERVTGKQPVSAIGAVAVVDTKAPDSIVLPNDDLAAENMLTEMFGSTGFRVARLTDGSWKLQYKPSNQPLKALDQLEREKELQIELDQEATSQKSLGERMADEFKGIMAIDAAGQQQRQDMFSFTKEAALRDTARELLSQLQDAGLVPSTAGVTRPLPEFASADAVMGYILGEVAKQRDAAGVPLNSSTAQVDDRYVGIRSKLLKTMEGVRSKVYADSLDHPTVGVGINLDAQYNVDFLESIGVDVKKLRAGQISLTDEQIELSFENAVSVAEKVVSDRIKVPLNAHQRAALVSLAYNGPSLLSSDLVDAVNAKDWDLAVKILQEKQFNNSRRRAEAIYLGHGIGEDSLKGGASSDRLRSRKKSGSHDMTRVVLSAADKEEIAKFYGKWSWLFEGPRNVDSFFFRMQQERRNEEIMNLRR